MIIGVDDGRDWLDRQIYKSFSDVFNQKQEVSFMGIWGKMGKGIEISRVPSCETKYAP